jgi:hypothetical protein
VDQEQEDKHMGHIPKNSEWYLGDVVLEITVEANPTSVIHINTFLINAKSPQDAYEKARQLGFIEVGEPYLNPEGKKVTTKFLGLKDLSVIHGKLEHGTELFFSERLGLTATQIAELTLPKDQLSVFTDVTPSPGPDYSHGGIASDFSDFIKKI